MSELAEGESFYVIVGSAAGALIGLQFVVMALVAEKPPLRAAESGAAFATPTIVHFSSVLLLSALARVPWQTITSAAVLWGFVGLGGFAYSLIVARRVRRQGSYQTGFEDWLCHAVVPMAAYAVLALLAFVAPSRTGDALLGIGAVALVLLFTAIHNAWDAIAYYALVSSANRER
jgi:hypothetical protein